MKGWNYPLCFIREFWHSFPNNNQISRLINWSTNKVIIFVRSVTPMRVGLYVLINKSKVKLLMMANYCILQWEEGLAQNAKRRRKPEETAARWSLKHADQGQLQVIYNTNDEKSCGSSNRYKTKGAQQLPKQWIWLTITDELIVTQRWNSHRG